MELKRDIYGDLLKWKQKSRKVLELKGARQTGKTFILDKFGRENYTVYIYINMAQTTGQEFLACLDQAGKWEVGEPRPTDPIYRALKLFDPRFDDTTETLVVIDEIQESARVYSLICQMCIRDRCGRILDLPLVDHIVLGSQGWFMSFAELGLLENRFEIA